MSKWIVILTVPASKLEASYGPYSENAAEQVAQQIREWAEAREQGVEVETLPLGQWPDDDLEARSGGTPA